MDANLNEWWYALDGVKPLDNYPQNAAEVQAASDDEYAQALARAIALVQS